MADITLPPKFITKDDFIANWFSWKNNFFICMKHIDKTETNKHLWGIMLLNRMGPVGQEIHRTFPFYNRNDTDINILIKKFDIYCIYGDRRRNGKSIDEYIINLKLIAIKHNYLDPTSIVKEKIIQEITTRRFRGQAAHVIRSKGKNLIPYLQSLDLNNIIRFWKYCEDLMPPKKGKRKTK
ncbi:uncharacterized protein LOC105430410 [Pogonomyrmex barbatus]|uniref:Uncharacterized protein LOC105430410 n=1 Tax=Pogonomyrmex barbatus TaxID=144034 RepID=A0A6I9WHW2_9HYME|nr:uncharacterized protein LOC105430410 [Pogonomyrmex barbatus]